MLLATCVWRRRGAGIVGLPNVGKSTFFNALTGSQLAKTGNFPFCTINANKSKVPLHDRRLSLIAQFSKAEKIVRAEVDLTDVAGLIKGASKGEGLGNQFLNDIRQSDVVLHMVRCFQCEKEGFDTPDPIGDIAVILNELILADLQTVEKRFHKLKSRGPSDREVQLCKKILSQLEGGAPVNQLYPTETRRGRLAVATGAVPGAPSNTDAAAAAERMEERRLLRDYQLLTAKPMIFVLNVDDGSMKNGNKFSALVENMYGKEQTCVVSAAVEEQIAQLTSREERLVFLEEYGISEPRGEELMRKVYDVLGLQSFFTVGPLQVHAWTVLQGASVRQASGEIHSDFEKHFLRAKIMPWCEMIKKPNLESAEMQMTYVDEKYVLNDGDVIIVEHAAPK